VRLLATRGGQLNRRTRGVGGAEGKTPLYMAASKGIKAVEICRTLLELGADADQRSLVCRRGAAQGLYTISLYY
jgi:hypothetical protein